MAEIAPFRIGVKMADAEHPRARTPMVGSPSYHRSLRGPDGIYASDIMDGEIMEHPVANRKSMEMHFNIVDSNSNGNAIATAENIFYMTSIIYALMKP